MEDGKVNPVPAPKEVVSAPGDAAKPEVDVGGTTTEGPQERMNVHPKSAFDKIQQIARPSDSVPLLPFFEWEPPYPSYKFEETEIERFARQLEVSRIVWLYSPSRAVAESLAWQGLDRLGTEAGRRFKVDVDAGRASLDFLGHGLDRLHSDFPAEGESRYVELSLTNGSLLQTALLKASGALSALREQLASKGMLYVFWSAKRLEPRAATVAGDVAVEFAVRTIRAILSNTISDHLVEAELKRIEERAAIGELDESALSAEAVLAADSGEDKLIEWLEDVKIRRRGAEGTLFRNRYAPEIEKAFTRADKSPLQKVALYLAGCFDNISFEDFLTLGRVLLAGKQRIVALSSLPSESPAGVDPQTIHQRIEWWSDIWSQEIDGICKELKVQVSPTVRLGMIVSPQDFTSHISANYPAFHRDCLVTLGNAGLLNWRNEAISERFVDLYSEIGRSNANHYIQGLLTLVDRIPVSRHAAVPGASIESSETDMLSDDRQTLERIAGLLQRFSELRIKPSIAAQCLRHWLKKANWSMFFQMVEVLSRRGVVRRLDWWNEYCSRFPDAPVSDEELATVIDSLVSQSGSMSALLELLTDFEECSSKEEPAGALIEQVWLAALLAGTWWSITVDGKSPPKGCLVLGALGLDDHRLRKLAKKIAGLDFGSGRVRLALKTEATDIYISAMALLTKSEVENAHAMSVAFPKLPEVEVTASAALAAVLTAWSSIDVKDVDAESSAAGLGRVRTFIQTLVEEMEPKQRHQLSRGVRVVERWLDENLRAAASAHDRESRLRAGRYGLKRTRARELHAIVVKPVDGRARSPGSA